MRIRIKFAKTEAMRFTSHLDLHRTWERTFRRAKLPLAYTQGFSPHPRINLASALPLGFTGQNEVVDVWLERDLSIHEIQEALRSAQPPGLQVQEVQEVDLRLPALQAELEASEYTITFLEFLPDLVARLETLLKEISLPRMWRNKSYDLRPLILALHPLPVDESGRQRIFTCLAAREGATGRPEEVVAALGISPEITRVHRQRVVFH